MKFLASSRPGPSPKIGDVHIDGFTAIQGGREYDETEVGLEQGAPIAAHRQRIRVPLQVEVLVSNSEPRALSLTTGQWELNHAEQTKARVENLLLLGSTVKVFDGRKFRRTGANSTAWRIRSIRDQEAISETGVWRATIIFGEVAALTTTFTSIDEELAASEQDAADSVVDKGQQSTETVPADIAATIPT